MSKKFIFVLILIAVGMFGLAASRGGTPSPVKPQFSSLESMVGKPAPDFTLKDQNGKDFKLSSLHGRKVVLFFNEGIMCYPACWNQMAELGSDKKLNNDSVVSASIVTDTPDMWNEAFAKMPALRSGTILFDNPVKVSTAYGMLSLESSMHKGSKPGHTYIVVDQQGVVRYTYDDPKMGIRNDMIIDKINKS